MCINPQPPIDPINNEMESDDDSDTTPTPITPFETHVKKRNLKTNPVTLAQLRSKNTPFSAWASVHGKVIDISDFGKQHPGGDIIFLAAGKDATALVETYHPRGIPSGILDRLQIGVMKEGEIQDSFYSWHSPFYKVLKKRVIERLESRNLARRGSIEIWVKAILILVGFWGSLLKMYFAQTFGIAAAWSILMGLFAHFVGTCIQHDGNHGAFSSNKLLNKVSGATMDMIGASAFTWEIQHMLGHHPYTNVLDTDGERRKENGEEDDAEHFLATVDQESDPDVFSSFPLMRMHPVHDPEWYHRYQHIYAPALFALMTLAKVFQQDFEVASTHRLYHIDANCRYADISNVIRFYSMKIISMCYMMILPLYFHGWKNGTLLFIIGHLTCGESLATMFIVNHVIEGVAFVQKDNSIDSSHVGKPITAAGKTPMEETAKEAAILLAAQNTTVKNNTQENLTTGSIKKLKNMSPVPLNDWAAVQCQTSVNWSTGSWFWNHFSGGLCHQIEHHLFPSICHTNYVYIQDVVESTCREYGVPYQAEPSLFSAYFKMISHLKALGREKVA